MKKNWVRRAIANVPGARASIRWVREHRHVKRARDIRYYWHDFSTYGKSMDWRKRGRSYSKISSELIFQYHKLEKGLCLPPPLRFFGVDAINATLNLMQEWREHGLSTDHQIYSAALDTVTAYKARLKVTPPPADLAEDILTRIEAVLVDFDTSRAIATPFQPPSLPLNAASSLHMIAMARRSIRSFTGEPVDFAKVEAALETAMLSPSACNRQPWQLHFYDNRIEIDALLKLQNGNVGFGHTIPLLVAVTADTTAFFGIEERLQPILDAGLFLSVFLLALETNSLSSCCLNWCVPVENDRKAHTIGNIPKEHQIVTLLAIGMKAPQALAPRSHRRPLKDCLTFH